MVEHQLDSYDKAFEIAVVSLDYLSDEIKVGELSPRQRGVVVDIIRHKSVTRQETAEAFEQVAVITEDSFFFRAARHALVSRRLSPADGICISTRRL